MKIIKRNGQECDYDENKIQNAISKANQEVEPADRLSEKMIAAISEEVGKELLTFTYAPKVEEIQDIVESKLIRYGAATVARKYIKYRYKHELIRKKNTTDDTILSLVECENEDVNQENSNKNATINSTQRDYIAGEVSKDLTNRILLPEEIIKAHNEGIIHFHEKIVA